MKISKNIFSSFNVQDNDNMFNLIGNAYICKNTNNIKRYFR